MCLVCKDCFQHRTAEGKVETLLGTLRQAWPRIRIEDAKNKPFDPTSRQPIAFYDEKGEPRVLPYSEWLLKVAKTNGRAGT